jgi:hypothetical protein
MTSHKDFGESTTAAEVVAAFGSQVKDKTSK